MNRQTKMSFFIMGYGHLRAKQYLKGCIYLAVQIAFMMYLVHIGFEQIVGLITLGDKPYDVFNGITGDHSTFMMVYGVFAWMVTALFFVIYRVSIVDCIKVYNQIEEGKKLPTTKEIISSLVNEKFYVTMLFLPVLGAIFFTIIPLIFMVLIAFTNFGAPNHLPPAQLIDWVGFGSFRKLFSLRVYADTIYKIGSWNIVWATVSTFVYYFGGVFLAVLINRKGIKGKKFFRSSILMSFAVPSFISLLGLRYFFSPFGPLNKFLMGTFELAGPIDFLVSKWSARTTAFFVGGWLAIPTTMLLVTGILTSIPEEVYEAAKIEGATKLQIFHRITLPHVIFATTPVLISSFMANFNNFGLFYFFTGSRPYSDGYFLANDSDLLINWLYNLSLENAYYAVAAAVGLILFVFMAISSLIVFTRSKSYRMEDEFR